MSDDLLGLPDRRWVPAALALNLHVGGYIHPSWFNSIPHGKLVSRLRTSPRSSAAVSRYLSEILDIPACACDDFSSPATRLALVDGATLERLFLYCGVALRSRELHLEIDGRRLREIRRGVGEDGYSFAFKRAPFLGRLPSFDFEPPIADPRLRYSLIGARFCAEHVAAVSGGLLRCLSLKLPVSWAPTVAEARNCPADEAGLPSLLRKLIKEMFPQWFPLFA